MTVLWSVPLCNISLSHAMADQSVCAACGAVKCRKRSIRCAICEGCFHLSSVGLTRAQAEVIERWTCRQCRGIAEGPVRAQALPLDLQKYVGECRHRLRVLNRIPKGAVISAADALQRLIRNVLNGNSELAWGRLFSFSYWGLGCPSGSGEARQVSLATQVRQQISRFMELENLPNVQEVPMVVRGARGGDEQLRRRVAGKFADGDVSGAVRELASDGGLAPYNDRTLEALRGKHPSAPEDLSLPEPPDDAVDPVVASEDDVRKAILSFRAGSSGGPDGLRPGHLRSLIGHGAAEAGSRLLTALTDLVNIILRGGVPNFAVPILFGATICALQKKDGGIRPVAVGNTFRRLATKIGARSIMAALGNDLRPVQLGVSTQGGCEAAVHAARRYIRDCVHRRVLLKVDMRNAFNCLRRDAFLSVARARTASLFKLLWQAYSTPSTLFFGEERLVSETGIQQGDPFGPALFALTVDEAARGVQSEFNAWYLDDATLGDSPEKVRDDLVVLLDKLAAIGLEVNSSKCELSILNDDRPEATEAIFRAVLPEVKVVQISDLSLLGAPLDQNRIPRILLEKKESLDRMTTKLELLERHQGFVLLRNVFAIPKLQYILRASPAYLCTNELNVFDRALFDSLGRVTNVSFTGESEKQAGLPVGFGGLGCRRVGDIALPSFLASMNSVGDLVEAILSKVNIADTNELEDAVVAWRGISGCVTLPDEPNRQKCWDLPLVKRSWEEMLRGADQVSRARCLAAAQKESGAWLNALPVPSLGTLLDSESFRIAIALRVGADICIPHSCRCGRMMDRKGLHGLSCRYSAGRHPRHSAMNDVVKRALLKAGLPSVLEPPGLDRGDGSRPDGITVFPFSRGKSLVWDCTCVDTFAESHLNQSAIEAGAAAKGAEDRKRHKYAALAEAHQFEPIAVETTGVYGASTGLILRAIGRRIVETTGEPREAVWFYQNLGIAIQRGNAFSILSSGRERF